MICVVCVSVTKGGHSGAGCDLASTYRLHNNTSHLSSTQ